jgi:hypothetical protein
VEGRCDRKALSATSHAAPHSWLVVCGNETAVTGTAQSSLPRSMCPKQPGKLTEADTGRFVLCPLVRRSISDAYLRQAEKTTDVARRRLAELRVLPVELRGVFIAYTEASAPRVKMLAKH